VEKMKYAVVTGSTKGIGKAISQKLLSDGYFVFLNYSNDDDTASNLRQELDCNYKGHFEIIKADLSEFTGLETFIKAICEKTDIIHYVVINAGVINRSYMDDITPNEWSHVMSANLTIPFFLIKELKPFMKKEGSILLMGSHFGLVPHSISVAYGVSKAGLCHMAKCLVKEFANLNVTVNAIAPGFVDTGFQKDVPPDIRASKVSKTAAGRFATATEIADLCHQMLHNKYINGSVYEINGGYNYK
jgi:NAD(P)-dependent dehydrogenase (short-subunit alcohol dehydrogenase family)